MSDESKFDNIDEALKDLTYEKASEMSRAALRDPVLSAAAMLALIQIMREHNIDTVTVNPSEGPSDTMQALAGYIDRANRTFTFKVVKDVMHPVVPPHQIN